MGMGPDGYLLYGYDLGGSDGEWAIDEYTENYWEQHVPELNVPWYLEVERRDREADEAGVDTGYVGGSDFRSLMEDRLMEARLGVEIHSVGHLEYGSGAVLTVTDSRINVQWSEVEALEMVDLFWKPFQEGWGDKLQRALDVLEIHPVQERPSWLLACAYG